MILLERYEVGEICTHEDFDRKLFQDSEMSIWQWNNHIMYWELGDANSQIFASGVQEGMAKAESQGDIELNLSI
jgi:hypothetical protein